MDGIKISNEITHEIKRRFLEILTFSDFKKIINAINMKIGAER